jgi:hypothetical protein
LGRKSSIIHIIYFQLINEFFYVNEFDFCGPFWNIFEVIFRRKVIPKLSMEPFNLRFCEGL